MNQQLQKLASNAGKCFALWKAQMQRDGFTKREQLSADTANYDSMGPAAKALWLDYVEAQTQLNNEAGHPGQPSMQLDLPKRPTKVPPAAPPIHVGADVGGMKMPGETQDSSVGRITMQQGPPNVPKGLPVETVDQSRFDAIVSADAVEALAKPKPSLTPKQVITIGTTDFVNVGSDVPGRCVKLVPIYTEAHWHTLGRKVKEQIEGDDFGGLVFKLRKPGVKAADMPRFVLGDPSDVVAVVPGDPLSHLSVEEGGLASAPAMAEAPEPEPAEVSDEYDDGDFAAS